MTDIYLSIAVIVVVLASVYWFWFRDTFPIPWLNFENEDEDEVDNDSKVETYDTVNEPYLDDEDIRFLKQMEGDIAETESDDF